LNVGEKRMKGLAVWANSHCRSTLSFYRELSRSFGVPLRILLYKKGNALRMNVGFTESEFQDLDIRYLSTYEDGVSALNELCDWNHLFGVYQASSIHQQLICEASRLGIRVAIASESPCNMYPMPKRFFKQLYIDYVLPIRLKSAIQASEFIINYSGADNAGLKRIGWEKDRIIECGYYSPPLIGSHPRQRTIDDWRHFSILLTGKHEWFRSPDLLLHALEVIERKGLKYECYITQEGDMLERLKRLAQKKGLSHVHFLGMVPMEKLIELYESCSVMVGCGNHEPWGMRLNDALQCGAPLIVNRGMGGSLLVEKYGCGLTFGPNDSSSLANAILRLVQDQKLYLRMADNAMRAAKEIAPDTQASAIAEQIRNRFPAWV